MEKFLQNPDNIENSINRDFEILVAILQSGNSVELPATGYSMFPTFKPGDRVVVKPLAKEEIPKTGSVVVLKENDGLVMHRLLKTIPPDTGDMMFITHGDSRMEPDNPWSRQQLIGIAVSYKRKGKENSVKTFVPASWRYLFNRWVLWLYFKLNN